MHTTHMTMGRKALLILVMAAMATAVLLSPLTKAAPAHAASAYAPAVIMFEHADYDGDWLLFVEDHGAPENNFPSHSTYLGYFGWNDKASSLGVDIPINSPTDPYSVYVQMFSDWYYNGYVFGGGDGLSTDGTTHGEWFLASLVPYGWNDTISSIQFCSSGSLGILCNG